MYYTLAHADTCLADYWGGHHLPHVQVPVHRGMTACELRDALRDEVNLGAIAGADAPRRHRRGAHSAMLDAILALRIYSAQPFADLENDEDVYAFFVFLPAPAAAFKE